MFHCQGLFVIQNLVDCISVTLQVILAYELDLISPNINYETPRKDLIGVHAGRIKIIVDPTPFQNENGLVGKFI